MNRGLCMPALIAIVAAVGLLYFLVLRDSKPKQKSKPKEEEYAEDNPIYFFMMLGLMVLPIILSFLIIRWNQGFIHSSFEAINWHVFIFSWQTVNYLTWIICGFLTVAFYGYMIFIKRYYLLILAALVQVGIFVFVWLVWLLFNGSLDVFDSVTVEDTDYHLVQTATNGNGQLYLFTCKDALCNAEKIDYVDSVNYYDAELTYDVETNSLTVFSDSGHGPSNESMDDETIIVPLED